MKLLLFTFAFLLSFNYCYANHGLKPRVHCSSVQKRDLLTTKLKENNISYHLQHLGPDNREYVIWSSIDDDRARNIIGTYLDCSCGDPAKDSTAMINDKQTEYLAKLLSKNGIEFKVIDNPFIDGPKNSIKYDLKDKENVKTLVIKALREVPYTK